MQASPLVRLRSELEDPFGFTHAFHDLHLTSEDLPGLTREKRLAGYGS